MSGLQAQDVFFACLAACIGKFVVLPGRMLRKSLDVSSPPKRSSFLSAPPATRSMVDTSRAVGPRRAHYPAPVRGRFNLPAQHAGRGTRRCFITAQDIRSDREFWPVTCQRHSRAPGSAQWRGTLCKQASRRAGDRDAQVAGWKRATIRHKLSSASWS